MSFQFTIYIGVSIFRTLQWYPYILHVKSRSALKMSVYHINFEKNVRHIPGRLIRIRFPLLSDVLEII